MFSCQLTPPPPLEHPICTDVRPIRTSSTPPLSHSDCMALALAYLVVFVRAADTEQKAGGEPGIPGADGGDDSLHEPLDGRLDGSDGVQLLQVRPAA